MPRGEPTAVGTETPTPQGYVNVKTETGWRLKHHIIAEEQLGRPLRADERVLFIDKDKSNYSPDNFEVVVVRARTITIAKLIAKTDKMAEDLDDIRSKLRELSD